MKCKVLRCNNVTRFVAEDGNTIQKYDHSIPGVTFHLFDKKTGKEEVIDSSSIYLEFGGSICFRKNGEKFIIDDGYRDVLVSAGYLVAENYDSVRILDKQLGSKTRTKIMNDIAKCFENNYILSKSSSKITVLGESKCFSYTINFSTSSDIVYRNELRKENNIAVYPFNKNMDKYGTIYISIFAERKTDAPTVKSYTKEFDVQSIIATIVNSINDLKFEDSNEKFNYHYVAVPITKRIINCEGL